MQKLLFTSLILGSTILFAQNQIKAAADSFQKAATPAPAATPTAQKARKLTIQEAATKAVNSVRTHPQICSKATTPLRWNKHLYNMSKEHSIDMAVTGLLQHNGSGTATDVTAKRLNLKRGSYFFERVNQKVDSKNLFSGELVIRTSLESLSSPKTVISYWVKDPKNCKLIMDPRFTDFAMAKVISNKDNRAYWTLLFAGKRK